MRSFVYRWVDLATGKMYIGVHKGTEFDGYICSSRHMLKEYNHRPHDFSREILEWFDDYSDARNREIEMLTEVNAAANPLYYNKSNGTGLNVSMMFDEEHRINISKASLLRFSNPEERKKLSIAHTGKVYGPYSEARKQKSRKPKSEETRARMRHPKTEEHKQNMRKPKSPEAIMNMTIAQRKRFS